MSLPNNSRKPKTTPVKLLSSTAEESSTSHLLSKGLQQLKVLITLLAVPITSEL